MQITVLLGGHLRYEGGRGEQLVVLEIPLGSRVEDLFSRLGLPLDRVKMIMVNGRGGTPGTSLQERDRVALFPPELAFNTFVSIGFRKESVATRRKAKDVGRKETEDRSQESEGL